MAEGMKTGPDPKRLKDLLGELGRGEYRDGSSTRAGTTYHPLPSVELATKVPHHKGLAVESQALLADVPEGGLMLDIGASVGFFSIGLADRFTTVIAYEADPAAAAVLRECARGRNVLVKAKHFTLQDARSLPLIDVCLMLNVHMWIEKQQGKERTLELMREIERRTGGFYFQTASKESGGRCQVQWLRGEQDEQSYLHACGWEKVTKIAESKEHGGVRRLWRCE